MKTPKNSRYKNISIKEQQKKQLFIGLSFYIVLAIMAVTTHISWVIFGWYVVIGGVTYAVYVKDKKAALNNQWRTPEITLHMLSVIGGWVGAMVAQNILRHKTRKSDFKMMFYVTVLVNLSVLLYLIASDYFHTSL